MAQTEPDGGIGDRVLAGDLSFRIFDVRSRDRVYAMSKPGAAPKTRGDIESEYVAIDYLTENVSGSPLTTGAIRSLISNQPVRVRSALSTSSSSSRTNGDEPGIPARRERPISRSVRMAMPTDVGIIDTMIGFPHKDMKEVYAFITRQTKDRESKEDFAFPVEYMFKQVPEKEYLDVDDRFRLGVSSCLKLQFGNGVESMSGNASGTRPRCLRTASYDPSAKP